MSTLNSTNMSVNRPTTRVRHAPGGSSSFSLSGEYDEKPIKSSFNPSFNPSFEESVSEVETVQPEVFAPASPARPVAVAATPVQPEVVMPPTPPPTKALEQMTLVSPIRSAASIITPSDAAVGVVFAKCSTVNEALKNRTLEALKARGVTDVSLLEVADVLQLPFAARQMVAKGQLSAVIVIAALTEEVWASKEIAAAAVNGIVQLSLEKAVPVIPGFIFAETEKQAMTKAIDTPSTWVSSALALSKPDCITTMSYGIPKMPTPEMTSSPMSEKTADCSNPAAGKMMRPPVPIETPSRGRRHCGGGPSSIVLG